MKDRCPEARKEGRTAFHEGKPPSANPYEKGTPENREWYRTWRYGKHQSQKTPKKGGAFREEIMERQRK